MAAGAGELLGAVQEKRLAAEANAATLNDVRRQHKEAVEQHAEAEKEVAAAEQAKFEILPAYERAVANKEQKERVEALRREIQVAETRLAEYDNEAKVLSAKLAEVSSLYKDEREAKVLLSVDAKQLVEGLRQATAHKIAATIDGVRTDATDETTPFDILDIVEEIARERDHLLYNLSRQLREAKAVCAMKRAEEQRLLEEMAKLTEERRRQNDEEVKQIIYTYQERRSQLQSDIDEVKKINQEQAFNLRRGHVETPVDPQRFTRAPASARTTSSQTSTSGGKASGGVAARSGLRKAAAVSPDLQTMQHRTRDAQLELASLKDQLTKTVKTRSDLVKDVKALETRLKRDEDAVTAELHKLEAQIRSERAASAKSEQENSRLAEAVQHLTGILRTTKKHIDHVRDGSLALPIEH